MLEHQELLPQFITLYFYSISLRTTAKTNIFNKLTTVPTNQLRRHKDYL